MAELARRTIRLDEITVKSYVRSAPSEERVLLFMDLLTSDESDRVPPMTIRPNGELIDGRHRLMAYQRLQVETVEVAVDPSIRDDCDLTMAAIRANVGGSKELSFADIRKSIIDLLAKGFSQSRIRKGLPYPKDMARRFLADAQTQWRRARLSAAVISVKNKTMTTEVAAAAYKIEADDITCFIRRETKGDELQLSNMGSAKGAITVKYYGFSKRMTLFYKRLAQKYEEGVVTEAQLLEIVAHSEHQARVHLGHIQDWVGRFKVMVQTRRPILPSDGKLPQKKLFVNEASRARAEAARDRAE
jgi:hypothetical protein